MMMFVKLRAICARICRNISLISRIVSIVLVWLFFAWAIVFDYQHNVAHPPTDVIPSSYESPDLTLVLIVLAIMVLELIVVAWLLHPWKQENLRRRVVRLAILNFVWGICSGLISSRPPVPITFHFGWLLLLEIVLVVDIFVAVTRWLLRSVYRAIHRLNWPRMRWR